ncbi:hypothetical protein [Halomonas sp. BC04]|uniref:hypothetical protein n=1 Tax=Halomonas sp. BC04 TaxID=1403540 RepID=UPI0003ED6FE0|nr:hypothetical protein [Halomonas sp. BC04]EWH01110.1 hypothetical protein Q427_15310 [Halomonas sp. BC04]
MASRVEMFGPMGAGKSTVLKALSKNKIIIKNKDKILTQRQIEKLEFLEQVKRDSILEYLAYKVSFLFNFVEEKFIFKHINSAAWQSINKYEGLPALEDIWRVTVGNRRYASINAELELKRMFWFVKAIANCALMESSDKATVALQDESFIQRGISLSFQDINYHENLEPYYTIMPLPILAIHVTAPDSLLKTRVEKRDGSQSSAIKYLNKSIEISKEVERILEKRGCEVFSINTAVPVSDYIDSLAKHIIKISENTLFSEFDFREKSHKEL